jgi:uncharacterized phage protein (TIGR02218 family)
MRKISKQLEEHLAEEVTSLATCWKLTLKSGEIIGFTNHQYNLIIDAQLYIAASGFTPSALASNNSLAVDNMEIEGILDHEILQEQDILAGVYDYAEIEVFMVNYLDHRQGKIHLKRGWLGTITVKNKRFIAEVRGITQKLSTPIGELYSPLCRATFGDTRCKVDLKQYSKKGVVTGISDKLIIFDKELKEEIGYYDFGTILFESGRNHGQQGEIKEYSPGQITLSLPMRYDPMVGDRYIITAGCDRNFNSCCRRFNNAINFRGEPNLPGHDQLFKTSNTSF